MTMGSSACVAALSDHVARVAPTELSVLLIGDTGTGKELLAQAIHACSEPPHGPFIAVDCGAIPEALIESELFGHERGAFTGADRRHAGRFEQAEGGTLFLDEISNLAASVQYKLLRALQERRFYRIGGKAPIEMRTRLVAASNFALHPARGPAAPVFRADLYHRIGEYVIHLPRLDERREDIPFLVRRFIELTNAELGRAVRGISPAAMEALSRHRFSGNVRELRNLIRRAVLWSDETIQVDALDLPAAAVAAPRFTAAAPASLLPDLRELLPQDGPIPSLREVQQRACAEAERRLLSLLMERTGGNIAEVARLAQADYKTIHGKIKRLRREERP